MADAPSQKVALAILATAQAAYYNCTLQAVFVEGRFQGVGANCGGQHFSAGARPK